MKKILLLCVTLICTGQVFSQKQTFDVATFTAPRGWKKDASEHALQLSKEDTTKGTYCLILLYKALPGTADAAENFEIAWSSIVKEAVSVSGEPEMNELQENNGWQIHSGYAAYENEDGKGVVILSTGTGGKQMVNLLVLTNTDQYETEMEQFMKSISLKKITAPAANATKPAKPDISPVITSWTAIANDQDSYLVNNGVAGYIQRQYTFNPDGTYKHYVKTFSFFSELFLTKETGTFTVSGNTIIVMPKQAVIERWSKKDNKDAWGKMLSSQKAPMERVEYQFTINYNETISETQLILQSSKATKRDGHFHQDNKWYYKKPKAEYDYVKLPG